MSTPSLPWNIPFDKVAKQFSKCSSCNPTYQSIQAIQHTMASRQSNIPRHPGHPTCNPSSSKQLILMMVGDHKAISLYIAIIAKHNHFAASLSIEALSKTIHHRARLETIHHQACLETLQISASVNSIHPFTME